METCRARTSAGVVALAATVAGLAVLPGCVTVEPPPPPTQVIFENATSRDLTPNFYFDDVATTPGALFVVAHLNTSFIDRAFAEMRPGETASTMLECDQIASLGVSRPRLFDAATLTVTQSEDVIILVREQDFACGDTIHFRYFVENGALRVTVTVE